jgi:hypothetical protein
MANLVTNVVVNWMVIFLDQWAFKSMAGICMVF